MTQAQQEALDHVRTMTAEEIEEVFYFNPALQERLRAVLLKPAKAKQAEAAELRRKAAMFDELVGALKNLRQASERVNDRYIAGAPLSGSLGTMIEALAAATMEASVVIRKATKEQQ